MLVVVYDAHAPEQRRVAAVLQVVGLPAALQFVDVRAADAPVPNIDDPSKPDAPSTEIRVIDGDRTFSGYDGYRRVAWRLPWSWPALPLLYAPPFASLARRVYTTRRSTRTATPTIVGHDQPAPSTSKVRRAGVLPVLTMGAILVGGMIWAGATGVRDGWPFSIYPTFDSRVTVVQPLDETRIDIVSSAGVKQPLNLSVQLDWIPIPYRDSFLDNFSVHIVENPSRPEMVHQLWQVLTLGHNNLHDVSRIIIYGVVVSTLPGDVGKILQRIFVINRTCMAC
jgi:hypothetical protein